jgi:pyridinium-3,5-biscarboxylic acid mononucleotide synthase
MTADIRFDYARETRTGLPEAIFCPGKTAEQLIALLGESERRKHRLLLTRLTPELRVQLPYLLDYDPLSRIAWFGACPVIETPARVAIIAAGTSDLPVAREAARTLRFFGLASDEFADVGVAGLWRLMERIEALRLYPVLIAVAGMEGALFSVLAGLVSSLVIAVPTSTGYGVARDGETALFAALCGCGQGLLTVNIDNGFGAACAVRRLVLNAVALNGLQTDMHGSHCNSALAQGDQSGL